MSKNTVVPHWDGLKGHLDGIKLVICDLWGVMHNGLSLFPDAVDAVLACRQQGIKTVFLTNAPKPATVIKGQLRDKGLPEELLDNIVSSGSQTRDYVREKLAGKKLYHMGLKSDHQAVEGLPVTRVEDCISADFIFASGLDYKTAEDHVQVLEAAKERGVLFLCANPDRVVHVGDREWICAGAVADIYETMGGTVHWFGKPTKGAFDACLKKAGLSDKIKDDEVLVIGDSLLTDITGAVNAGHKSLLITSGIHRDSFRDLSQEIHWPALKGLPKPDGEGGSADYMPTAVMRHLRF